MQAMLNHVGNQVSRPQAQFLHTVFTKCGTGTHQAVYFDGPVSRANAIALLHTK